MTSDGRTRAEAYGDVPDPASKADSDSSSDSDSDLMLILGWDLSKSSRIVMTMTSHNNGSARF